MQREKMNMEKPSLSPFSLSDFYLAAYLLSKGMKLLRTEARGNNRVVFILEDSPDRPNLVQDYFAHRGHVDPLSYKDTVVILKSFLHGIKGIS